MIFLEQFLKLISEMIANRTYQIHKCIKNIILWMFTIIFCLCVEFENLFKQIQKWFYLCKQINIQKYNIQIEPRIVKDFHEWNIRRVCMYSWKQIFIFEIFLHAFINFRQLNFFKLADSYILFHQKVLFYFLFKL